MNRYASQLDFLRLIYSHKHTVIIGIGEYLAFDTLQKFNLKCLEQSCNVVATGRVSQNSKGGCRAFALGNEVLPNIHAVLIRISTVCNLLSS